MAQKHSVVVALPGSTQPFGSTNSYNFTVVGDNSVVNLYHAYLYVTVKISGLGGAAYTIKRPAIAWFNQAQSSITVGSGSNIEIVSYPSYGERGVAGYLYQILQSSYSEWTDYADIELLNTPVTQVYDVFEVRVPLRYLLDAASTSSWPVVRSMTLNLTWEPLSKIFTLPAGGLVEIPSMEITYPVMTMNDPGEIPESLRMLSPRASYLSINNIPVGSTTVPSITPNVGFSVSSVFYFFLSTSDGSPFTMNPNPQSIVTTHHLSNGGGLVLPSTVNYNSVYSPSARKGLARHFTELRQNSQTDQTGSDTILTFQRWSEQNRIYSIETGVPQKAGQTWNLAIQLSEPTTAPCSIVVVFVGNRLGFH
jgi:hypothetical protein